MTSFTFSAFSARQKLFQRFLRAESAKGSAWERFRKKFGFKALKVFRLRAGLREPACAHGPSFARFPDAPGGTEDEKTDETRRGREQRP